MRALTQSSGTGVSALKATFLLETVGLRKHSQIMPFVMTYKVVIPDYM